MNPKDFLRLCSDLCGLLDAYEATTGDVLSVLAFLDKHGRLRRKPEPSDCPTGACEPSPAARRED